MDRIDQILHMADQDATVEAMCAATGLKFSRVYGILREHRPNRPRQPRKRTSTLPAKVRALAALDPPTPPQRIARLLKITPAYVYAILNEPQA